MIILLLLPFTAFCQGDTTYFDSEWNKTNYDNAEFYGVMQELPDHTFKRTDYYLRHRNRVQMTGYYLTRDTNSKNGPFVYYDEKGKKAQEVLYKNNTRTGPFVSYGERGYKAVEANYENDTLNGEAKYYYQDTTILWYKRQYNRGKTDGEVTSYYLSGKLKRRELHVHSDTARSGKCYDENGNEIKYTPLEINARPFFPLYKYLANEFVYPKKAQVKNIEGRVLVKFIVNEDGSISNVKATNHLSDGCEEEAIRVVSQMPNWKPAILDDKTVKETFTLPIVFKLE